jgi:uncharacterized protein YndB with AHSA1/START domain
MTESTADVLTLSERIRATPDEVFEYLVGPEKLMRWMGTECDIEPHPGGRFWLNVNGLDIAVGSYLEVDRPHKVVFTWGWEGSSDVPPGSSTVTFTLTADGDETIVELSHQGLPGGAGDQHLEGWGLYLPRLGRAVDGEVLEPITRSA